LYKAQSSAQYYSLAASLSNQKTQLAALEGLSVYRKGLNLKEQSSAVVLESLCFAKLAV
jgi:hypothetical protein